MVSQAPLFLLVFALLDKLPPTLSSVRWGGRVSILNACS